MTRRLSVPSILCAITISLAACKPELRPLQYGLHQCDHCRMTLMDERYGGEIVMRTGKVYTFDSIECLTAFRLSDVAPDDDDIHGLYVVDYGKPGDLISIQSATFLRSTQLLSPMGANLTSFARQQDASGARDVFGGELLTWTEVREVVKDEWMSTAFQVDTTGG